MKTIKRTIEVSPGADLRSFIDNGWIFEGEGRNGLLLFSRVFKVEDK